MSYQDIGRRKYNPLVPPSGGTREGVGFAAAPVIAAGSAAGPIGTAVSLAATGIIMGLQVLFSRKKPQQKIEATKLVDEVAAYMKQNLDVFMASGQTQAEKDLHLAIYDQAEGDLIAALNNPILGDPGQTAIKERFRHLSNSAELRWDYRAYWRDPIEQTPAKQPTSVTQTMLGAGGPADGAKGLGALLLVGLGLFGLVSWAGSGD